MVVVVVVVMVMEMGFVMGFVVVVCGDDVFCGGVCSQIFLTPTPLTLPSPLALPSFLHPALTPRLLHSLILHPAYSSPLALPTPLLHSPISHPYTTHPSLCPHSFTLLTPHP
ncbi:hypothetical protein Pcinc_029195 [Petrolisthes cinctipes]|uniref:Uncharacterized protein n=1 Tax=Petrolisthes cinctipes TaxID=88211 RepID=A0AAE1K7X0_PETCI|nr:hypothetical protein Pcinc_029195 [Petrolisthes cinctipes]